jgi:hypothetical protein
MDSRFSSIQLTAACYEQLEQVQKAWEEEELTLKSALATTKAELAQLQPLKIRETER